ncbi:hypothetical protein [uncultured Fibrobacter sp.]|uniref:hypothetical protein n=1 Tax=uncultured Fibrobacter sp. TaxID=261512 RepID=UPI00261AFE6D|nr:hypothetical protein [uncultured Fibrobacter sp.]
MMAESESTKSKRILKNTLFLYFRMLFVMFIAFYTSRVVLDKLGVVDYGIHSVVGGLTSMFVFFRSSLSNVTQRYLNVALGKENADLALKTFCQHQTLYILIALVIVLLAETVGMWFLYNKLVIPAGRMTAAFWTFQLMVVSLVVTLLGVVYNSAIIAHENMKIYSYVGIYEGLAKLGIAFLISLSPVDRLIMYSVLLVLVAFSIQFFYYLYCKRKYAECKFHFLLNRNDVKETFSMIGWNSVGTAVWAINNQGIDILLNIFFGPVVNAAKAIASHLNHAINNYATNFFVSVRPQLTKSYAAQDYDYLMKLFYGTSKYSFFLLWFFCLPMMLCVDVVLSVWLKEVPENTGLFVNLILAYSLVNILNNPIWSIALAVGKLKRYICIGSSVFLMSFPISYVFLKLGFPAASVFITNICVRFVYIWVVLFIIKKYIPLSLVEYIKKVLFPIVGLVALSGGIGLIMHGLMSESVTHRVALGSLVMIINLLTICFIGLNAVERKALLVVFKKKVLKK